VSFVVSFAIDFLILVWIPHTRMLTNRSSSPMNSFNVFVDLFCAFADFAGCSCLDFSFARLLGRKQPLP